MLRIGFVITFVVFAFSIMANQALIRTFTEKDGQLIDEILVPGLPVEQRISGPVAEPSRTAIILSGVPAFDWCYGCSATSAAMLAGYYDRLNYGYVYTGPTNNGVIPVNNGTWGTGECPLSATHMGYDGLVTAGHVNRFWTGYGNSGDDPYGTSDPTGTYGNCTADYMGTNQDWWNNIDGGTTFYYYTNGTPIYDYSGSESSNPRKRDGTHGLRLFFESRGYTVSSNYNQYILGYNGNTNGITYDNYKSYIDSGVPVMIHVQGHTMLGMGYESTNSTIYIRDTWDHNLHTMTWGGSYSGMTHYGCSVIVLATPPTYVVSGTILDGNSLPLAGVNISGGGSYSAVTNSNGQYNLSVPYWWSGTVVPSFAGFLFTPVARNYTNVSGAVTGQNYVGYDISMAPQEITIVKAGNSLALSWDAYGFGVYRIYAYDNANGTSPVNVTSQGTFQTAGGRVTWTTAIPAAIRKFYKVRIVY